MKPPIETFGTKLKRLRKAARFTIAQAADSQGISPRLWAYWEANQKLPPTEGEAITQERILTRWKAS